MPDFAYTARDVAGQKVTGTIAATTEREAISLLSGRSLFPIDISVDAAASSKLSFTRRISGQLLATTYGQLAALLRCGVPMLRSLAVLRNQSSNVALKEVLQEVHDRVEDGSTLSDAMARYEKTFGEMAINMIRAGGEGGFLEDALDRVAKFTEQSEDLKSRTMGALAYPAFLAVVGFLVVTGLLVFFVPTFDELFDTLRQRGELPAATDWLLWTSANLNRWWWVMLIGIIFVGVYIRSMLETASGKRTRDLLKLRLPMVGRVFKNLAVARFCRVLGTLLHNGVPILKSLNISREATGNLILSEAIADASENISAGESLAIPLGKSGHFPPAVVEMIAVAEESNNLESVLTEIADSLELRTSRQLDLAVRLLEPVMLLVLASILLVVVIALLVPVLKMSSTIS